MRVRFADGTTETFEVPDVAAQAALLRRLLIDDGRDVLEFTEERAGLEDLFLAITQGIVAVNPVLAREVKERMRGPRAFVA